MNKQKNNIFYYASKLFTMKSKFILLLFLTIIFSFKLVSTYYNPDYVEISSVTYKDEKFSSIILSRKDNRVKLKYFTAKDENGKSVFARYEKWSLNNPNIILLAGGAYIDFYSGSVKPLGLTIDNGELINETLENDKMDALVIVYPTGGILATNLKNGDLAVGSNPNKKYNLRGNAWDKQEFIEWAKENNATVFQTHLLVYKNDLIVGLNSSQTQRERRFLAVGKDEEGNYKHIIVNYEKPISLKKGAQNALDFLNNLKNINLVFLINLDSGVNDVFKVYNKDGSINNNLKGRINPLEAQNLMVYYYE
jgi:hypothetical protein